MIERLAEAAKDDDGLKPALLGFENPHKEAEWLAKDEESKKTIDSLQAEVQEYESSLKEIGHEMLSLKEEITEKKIAEIAENVILLLVSSPFRIPPPRGEVVFSHFSR